MIVKTLHWKNLVFSIQIPVLIFTVVIRYFRGHIDDLVTEEDDPFWSIDMKMGFLSFFEVNFNERQSLQSLDNPVTVEHTDLMPKFYRVVEVCNGSVHRSYMSDFTKKVKEKRFKVVGFAKHFFFTCWQQV